MLYQRFNVVIIHRLFFSCNSLHSFIGYRWIYVFVFLFTISFLSYRGEPRRMYIRNENVNTMKKL